MTIMTIILTISLAALFVTPAMVAADNDDKDEKDSKNSNGKTHLVEMKATNLPNGQLAYQMMSHIIDSKDVTEQRYGANPTPSIPGPIIIMDEGDKVELTLYNDLGEGCVSVHTHGVHYPIESDGTLAQINKVVDSCATVDNPYTYEWNAAKGTAGTWPYHDHTFKSALGSEDKGLFGAIIVNDKKTTALIDGKVKNINTSSIDKEFVLYMVETTFWGVEIDNTNGGLQTPLWTNPTLVSKQGETDRFHVIGLGTAFHTWHMHAHRWLDDGTTNVIDTQTIGPLTRHVFTVKAGEGVGNGDWMYHCHVFAHMQAGMSGIYRVTDLGGPSIPGPSPLGDDSGNKLISFEIVDEPGPWFKNRAPLEGTSESLAIASPGDTVQFDMTNTATVHTITSLLYPVETSTSQDATNMPFDQAQAFKGGAQVTLEDPGLYVFTCKVHPYMFAAIIVDDPNTNGLDLGENIRIVNGITTPTASPLAVGLLKTFFTDTDPNNWQDYTDPTGWNVTFPPVDIRATGGAVVNLSALDVKGAELIAVNPPKNGIGEVWIDTQFETSDGNTKYGSATAVDTATWKVTKKVFGTGSNSMNHPHNMWTNTENDIIYQTQWFDSKLSTIDRDDAVVLDTITVGDSPSHVMTRPSDGNTAYIAMNGDNSDNSVVKVSLDSVSGALTNVGTLNIGAPHPHGHWMTNDIMVTPNAFTGTSSIYDFNTGDATVIPSTELLGVGNVFGVPIATGLHPSGEKYYVANLLDQTVTCVSTDEPACVDGTDLVSTKPIVLITGIPNLLTAGDLAPTQTGAAGLLPIQTPVDPTGRYVVTATLLPSITIIDTEIDEMVLSLACDAGCHGVNFGANVDGGYNAYVSSKFSNALIVFDPEDAVASDVDRNGILDADESSGVVGRIILSEQNASSDYKFDVSPNGSHGMGGQGVLAIPNPYDGWIQETVSSSDLSAEVQGWVNQLSPSQKDPYP
jgi:hypothetical protein